MVRGSTRPRSAETGVCRRDGGDDQHGAPLRPATARPSLRCGVPHGHYKAITFVFGLRLRGVVAPKAYDHAMNAETFEAWLEHCLLPTLEEGDIVVLDNLKAHKSPSVAEILARKN